MADEANAKLRQAKERTEQSESGRLLRTAVEVKEVKSMNTLALQNVSYKYEGTDKTIFKDVYLRFDAGKVYTIVGKSGTGKSTLLSLLSGLDTATSGQVDYNGENLSEINRNRYRAQKAGIISASRINKCEPIKILMERA